MSHAKNSAAPVILRLPGQGLLHCTVTETGKGAGRFVRVLLTGVAGTVAFDEHLRADADAPYRLRGIADVLVGTVSRPEDCRNAAVIATPRGEQCLLQCGVAGGSRPVVRVLLGAAHRAQAPWETWASVAHAWLVAGFPAEALVREAPVRPESSAARRHLDG